MSAIPEALKNWDWDKLQEKRAKQPGYTPPPRGADAEMEIITSPEVEKTITDYARTHQVTGIVIGASPRDGGPSMGERLQTLMPDVRIETMREA